MSDDERTMRIAFAATLVRRMTKGWPVEDAELLDVLREQMPKWTNPARSVAGP